MWDSIGMTFDGRIRPEHRLPDELTGLMSGTTLRADVEQIFSSGAIGAFVYMDIDDMKRLNDRHGSHIGDRVLVECSHRLRQVRDELNPQATADDFMIIVARIGGDEFLAFAPPALAEDFGHRAVEAFDRPFLVQDEYQPDAAELRLLVSLSAGIARTPTHGDTLVDLFDAAAHALHTVKAAGGDDARLAGAHT